MTPAEEARVIALWNAGTETAAMAQQLGIPRGHGGCILRGTFAPQHLCGEYDGARQWVKSDHRERLAYAQTIGEQLFKHVA